MNVDALFFVVDVNLSSKLLCAQNHIDCESNLYDVCVCVGVSVQLTKVWINSARSSKYTNKNIGEIALDKNIATTKSTAMEKN